MYLSVGSNFFGERKGFRQFSERLDWFEAVFECLKNFLWFTTPNPNFLKVGKNDQTFSSIFERGAVAKRNGYALDKGKNDQTIRL